MLNVIAVLIAATPAAQPDAAPRPTTVAVPAPTGAAPVRYGERTRFCVMTEVTGSRMLRRECRTRTDWLREDYDPLVDLKK